MITYQNQQSHSVREFMRGGKKQVELTKLSTDLPGNLRLFSVLTLIPGASIGYHVHEDETEMFYFIEGYGRVQDEDAVFDGLYAYATFWTSDEADGQGICRYIYQDKDILYRGRKSKTDFAASVRCVKE